MKIPRLHWWANPREAEAQEGIDRRENLTVFPHGTDFRTEQGPEDDEKATAERS